MSLPTSDLLPRCCRSHESWKALARCLLRSYTPPLEDAAVVEHVHRARQAVEVLIPLDDPTRLEIGELIARNQLEIACGRREECARMDPQPHVRARRTVGPTSGPLDAAPELEACSVTPAATHGLHPQ